MRLLPLLALLLTASLTYAQDNITLRNGDEIPAKVLEINQNDLKYRKTANPDGPIYTASLRDVLFIKYANGTKDSFGAARTPLLGQPADVARPNRPNRFNQHGSPNRMAPGRQSGDTSGLDGLRYHSRLFGGHYSTATGQHIDMAEAKSVFFSQPDALKAFNRGRSLRTWSWATAVPAVVMIGAGAGLSAFDGEGGGRGGRNGMRYDRTGTTPTDDDDDDRHGRGDGAMIGAAVAGTGVLLGMASVWLCHRSTMQFRKAATRYNGRAATSLHLAPSHRGVGLGAVLTF